MRLFNKNDSDDKTPKKPIEPEVSNDSSAPEEPKVSHQTTPSHTEGMRLVEEDSLLVQIDAFRDKAEQLQKLINDRQGKVLELENVVKEQEDKNNALKDELTHKQEALEGVLDDIKSQLDIFATRLDTSVNNAVNEAKEPVLEKVHSENVRLYRNLYDFMKEEYSQKKFEEMIDSSARKNSRPMLITLIFSIINTVMLIVLILHSMGVF